MGEKLVLVRERRKRTVSGLLLQLFDYRDDSFGATFVRHPLLEAQVVVHRHRGYQWHIGDDLMPRWPSDRRPLPRSSTLAARTLGREAGIAQSRTLASLNWRIAHNDIRLSPSHVASSMRRP